MTAKTKHLHKRVLALEIGDDEDVILFPPDSPETDALYDQGMELMWREGAIMERRGEAIAAWDKALQRGDDLTEFDERWKSVERELAENTAEREANARESQRITADLMKIERRKLMEAKAARLRGQA
jgi:hypothetical protein